MMHFSKEKKEELNELTGFSVEQLLRYACACASAQCDRMIEAYITINDAEGEEHYKRLRKAMGILMELID